MEIKVKVEKIETKVVICPICKKEITNMRNEYCQHLSRWNDEYAYFKNEMRIQNINPEYLKPGDEKKLLAEEIVPFFEGKVRLAKEEEISLLENLYNQKFERADGFIPIVWID